MAKKSILYIITKSVWGGAAKYVYDLSTNLMGKFDVAVAAGGQGQFYKKIKQTNIPYYQITNFQRTINPLKDLLAFFEILSLLFQLKPNIIHVNSSKAGGVVGVAGQIYRFFSHQKINLIFTAHGWAFNEDRYKWQISLIKLFSKITALFYDKIICVSQYDRQIAIENRIAPANKLVAIHNGIDIENISFFSKEEAQKKLLGKTSPLAIGTIAEWTKNKGLFYLLDALKDCPSNTVLQRRTVLEGQSLDIILIGSGENPDKEKIQDFIKKHQIKNVHLIEFIDNAVSYLKAFDIFVLPSLKEGLPYTIIEAMTAKVPIIATNVGGIPEIISSNLITPKNSRVLAEKITELIEIINNDPEKIKIITQKNRKRIEKEFSLEKMIEKTKNIYIFDI